MRKPGNEFYVSRYSLSCKHERVSAIETRIFGMEWGEEQMKARRVGMAIWLQRTADTGSVWCNVGPKNRQGRIPMRNGVRDGVMSGREQESDCKWTTEGSIDEMEKVERRWSAYLVVTNDEMRTKIEMLWCC
jgi:hypothetical protein